MSYVPTNFKISKRGRYELKVAVKTFGSRDSYELTTINVSKTGLLLGSQRNVPFQVNTLLELAIDTSSANFENPIECIGKVIRFADEPLKERDNFPALIGVAFSSDGDVSNFDRWSHFVDDVTRGEAVVLDEPEPPANDKKSKSRG